VIRCSPHQTIEPPFLYVTMKMCEVSKFSRFGDAKVKMRYETFGGAMTLCSACSKLRVHCVTPGGTIQYSKLLAYMYSPPTLRAALRLGLHFLFPLLLVQNIMSPNRAERISPLTKRICSPVYDMVSCLIHRMFSLSFGDLQNCFKFLNARQQMSKYAQCLLTGPVNLCPYTR
jgi:hypothetical protein